MDKIECLDALSALAHEARLDVFRLLVRAGPAGMAAGEIADALGARQNTMSTNLAILVLDNGLYGETGSQPSHTSGCCDLAAVARGCGIDDVFKVSSEQQLEAVVDRFHARGSLRFLHALVSADEAERVMPTRDAVANKLRFRRAIGSGNE